MDKKPRKGGGGGKTDWKEGTNKKLASRHKNGEKFLGTEKQTISYHGYTFRDWQSLSRDLCSNILDWRK